ncbi:MAG: ECF-type sigma factor [Phycisphaerales bacterium]
MTADGSNEERGAGGIVPRVYDELRELGQRMMRREGPGHTLQPTVLVHEVFLKLAREDAQQWSDEAHFRAVAAIAMKRVLIDHARARAASKRGGGRKPSLDGLDPAADTVIAPEDLLGLNDALEELRARSERQARVVELRYFGAMTFEQVAGILGVSVNTAKNDWRFARAWLQRRLEGGP